MARLVHSKSSGEESVLCLFLVIAGNPFYSLGCECITSTITPSFCPFSHGVLPACLSVSPNDLLIRASGIEFGARFNPAPIQSPIIAPMSYNLILTDYIFKILSQWGLTGGHELWGALFNPIQRGVALH